FTFMERTGFEVSTLEAYKENYKSRHGKDPSVEGLMDLTNNVIALNENLEGEDLLKVFTEEVTHLAIESYNNEEGLRSALLEISSTELYKERAEYYREKYKEQYSENKEGLYGLSELEFAVRKEILGQLVRDGLLDNNFKTSESRNIFQRF